MLGAAKPSNTLNNDEDIKKAVLFQKKGRHMQRLVLMDLINLPVLIVNRMLQHSRTMYTVMLEPAKAQVPVHQNIKLVKHVTRYFQRLQS